MMLFAVSGFASDIVLGKNNEITWGGESGNRIASFGGITATGGTMVTNDGYIYHSFLSGTNNFVVLVSSQLCEVLFFGGAGGAGGGGAPGGGSGAGGLIYTNIYLSGTNIAIVGSGRGAGTNGIASTFAGLTAWGGGRGASYRPFAAAGPGGSGGGGAGWSAGYNTFNGAAGTNGQGFAGGNGRGTNNTPYEAGGGGGAASVGSNGVAGSYKSGDGGIGKEYAQFAIVGGSPAGWFCGGGGGAGTDQGAVAGAGGKGGGGNGAPPGTSNAGANGVENTGGGAGGAHCGGGSFGGGGAIFIRYPL